MERLYGIWIEPPRIIRKELTVLIKNFAPIYDSPAGIIPHITLLPAVKGSTDSEMIVEIKQIAKTMSRIIITFNGLKAGDSYWKSIYMEAEKNAPLDLLFKEFRNHFLERLKIVPKEFAPHLSLLYGTYSPKIATKILADFNQFQFGKHPFNYHQQFLASEISLFYLEDLDVPSSWKLVKRIKLR